VGACLAGCAARAPTLSALGSSAAPARLELADVPFFPQQAYQCGPAALATVLTYSGRPTTPEALAPRVYLPGRQGSLQVELVGAVRREDRIPYVIQASLAALMAELQAGRPVVALQNLGLTRLPKWHFAVVIGYSKQDDAVVLRSGTRQRVNMSAYHFVRTWEPGGRWGLVVLRPGELPAADDADGYLRAVAAKEAVTGPAGLVQAYRAAVERWPESTLARFGLANALRANGQVAAAVAQYRVLVSESSGDAAALNNLADALNALGCREPALQTIERALALMPEPDPRRDVALQTREEILSGPPLGGGPREVCTE
jgi:tetratricopeptide (TPR) repeat protein